MAQREGPLVTQFPVNYRIMLGQHSFSFSFFFHSLSLSRSVFVRNSPTPPHISPLWKIEVDLGFAKLYLPAVSKDTLYVSAVLLNCHGAT